MPQLYDSPEREALQFKAIQSLAVETGHEFAMVKRIYEVELARLQSAAQVTEFVVLLSSRRAREALRGSANATQAQAVTA